MSEQTTLPEAEIFDILPGDRFVWCAEGGGFWRRVPSLEPDDPPRAPARTLAPGVESRPDVQGGQPVLAGTRVTTITVRGVGADWAAFHPAYPHVTPEQYERARCFEAGRDWQRERRRRRKEKRAVKRYERVKALAEGESS